MMAGRGHATAYELISACVQTHSSIGHLLNMWPSTAQDIHYFGLESNREPWWIVRTASCPPLPPNVAWCTKWAGADWSYKESTERKLGVLHGTYPAQLQVLDLIAARGGSAACIELKLPASVY